MSNETIPLNLFKANLELQLRLQRLVQENGQQWLENATRAGKDGIAESGAEIENLLKAKGRCEQVPDMRSCLSSGAMEQGSS